MSVDLLDAEEPDEPDAAWRAAAEARHVLLPLAQMGRKRRAAVDAAAAQLNISTAKAYRMIALLKEDDRASALLPEKRGRSPGSSMYDAAVEAIILEVLQKDYMSGQQPRVAHVLATVRARCRKAGLKQPGRKGLMARVQALDLHDRLKARRGKNAAEIATPRPGEFVAERPNQVWLIDHTEGDIILVDRRFRLPIGRPTVTLIIDAYTRMCVGCYVSLGKPSRIQSGMALLRAFLPKEGLLEQAGQDWDWPCQGFPEIVHSDNGSDFRSDAFRRGLITYGITPKFRPVREPRYGALIERYIGTTMGELHLVPGTTFSNVSDRGEYDSEAKAVMSLDGFERWLFLQIGRYHISPHRGIGGFTPISRWKESVNAGFRQKDAPPGAAVDIMLAFLPSDRRKLRNTGIHFKSLRYWSAWLGAAVRRGGVAVDLRYDPRDMSFVWVGWEGRWERVHLYKRQAPFTLREHELALKALREAAVATVDEDMIHAKREESEALIASEAATTKRARRRLEHGERSLEVAQTIYGEPEPAKPIITDLVFSKLAKSKRIVEEW